MSSNCPSPKISSYGNPGIVFSFCFLLAFLLIAIRHGRTLQILLVSEEIHRHLRINQLIIPVELMEETWIEMQSRFSPLNVEIERESDAEVSIVDLENVAYV